MPKLPKKNGPAEDTTRHQIAALPFRATSGRLEVCLVTTRETGRWTLPKGWPMKNLKDHAAARVEAEQEAGLSGDIGKKPVGSFKYFKRLQDCFELVTVTVYPMPVTTVFTDWKEKSTRLMQWATFEDASVVVDEPELKTLLHEIGRKPEALLKKIPLQSKA